MISLTENPPFLAYVKWGAAHNAFPCHSFSLLADKAWDPQPVLYDNKHGLTVVVKWIFLVVSVAQFRQYSTFRLNEVTNHIEAEARAGYLCRQDRTWMWPSQDSMLNVV